MAIYNEILSPRFARALQKLFSMKGAPPTRQLSGEIMGVVPLFHDVGDRVHEGWNLFAYGATPAASAANTSCVRLRNPLNSGMIAEILKIEFSAGANDIPPIRWGIASGDLANVASTVGVRIDARSSGGFGLAGSTTFGPNLILSSQNNAPAAPALSANSFTMNAPDVLAHTPYNMIPTDIDDLVMAPGDGTQVESANVNQQIRVFFIWRERVLEPSELQ